LSPNTIIDLPAARAYALRIKAAGGILQKNQIVTTNDIGQRNAHRPIGLAAVCPAVSPRRSRASPVLNATGNLASPAGRVCEPIRLRSFASFWNRLLNRVSKRMTYRPRPSSPGTTMTTRVASN